VKLKKNYSFSNKRQIWRLLPTDTNKLIIEERNTDAKQVYFNCLQLDSGKKVFKNLQFEEKFWIGIEAVYKDVIFFHRFAKPDMPQHRGIIAYDINLNSIAWYDPERSFQFVTDDKLYCYIEQFEGKKFFVCDYRSGEINEDVVTTGDKIKELNQKLISTGEEAGYIFPSTYSSNLIEKEDTKLFFDDLKKKYVITGRIEYISIDSCLMFTFHEVNSNGTLRNHFKTVDLETGKFILEETLNKETSLFISESFFVRDKLLFLLIEKTKLNVYSIKD
jgi:hypothetical protein